VSEPVVVDARGHRCPTPSLKLRKAMEDAPAGRRFVLLATDPMARIDVPYLMSQLGGAVIGIEEIDATLRLTVESGLPRPGVPTD